MALLESNKDDRVMQEPLLPILFEALYEEYNQEREGTHVSDILLCPRKTYFQKIHPLPITNIELNFFTSGKAIHGALQSLVKKFPHRYEIEKEVWLDDLVAHIDIFDKDDKSPIEAKSARIASISKDAVFGTLPKGSKEKSKVHYLRQLEAYMAMTDSDNGKILVQCLLNYGENPFVEFQHTMTKEQRLQVVQRLKAEAELLKQAIKTKNPNLVRHVAWNADLNWLCRSCKYTRECEISRADERDEMFNKTGK